MTDLNRVVFAKNIQAVTKFVKRSLFWAVPVTLIGWWVVSPAFSPKEDKTKGMLLNSYKWKSYAVMKDN